MLSETPKLISGIEDSHHGPSDAMHNPPQPLKVSYKTLVSFLMEITLISINFLTPSYLSDTKVFIMTMEILPELTSNKLCGISEWKLQRKENFISLDIERMEDMRRFHGMGYDAKEIGKPYKELGLVVMQIQRNAEAVFKHQFEAFKNIHMFWQWFALRSYIYSLFAKQSEDWDLLHEDLEQINDLDIEEMDINWQIAMIAIRMKKFYKKNEGEECTTKGTNDGQEEGESLSKIKKLGK
ncbi:hypothetical protein Tco_0881674 [Tanacetum coccineum]